MHLSIYFLHVDYLAVPQGKFGPLTRVQPHLRDVH